MMTENQSATAALYTEHPYPGDGVVRTTVARVVRAALGDSPRRILDVGCGTGEVTAGLAKMFPHAEVVAVDVNPPSLALAEKLAKRKELSIRFVRADILRDLPHALAGERFDLVTSLGVLHHLPDPAGGFRSVRPLIADDGRFLCFMYSQYGRWNDVAVRTLLDAAFPRTAFAERAAAVARLRLSDRHGFGEFLRGLRNRLRYGPPLPLLEMLSTYLARRNLVHVSDTFSNPCETYYEFRELEAIADQTGWSITGLAEKGGLPTTAGDDPVLARLSRADLFDFYAYLHRAFGFMYWLEPR